MQNETINQLIFSPIPVDDLVDRLADAMKSRMYPIPKEEPRDDIAIDEVSNITGLAHHTIYKRTSSKSKKQIPHAKFGKRLIFSRREILAWMEANTITPTNYEYQMIDQLAKSARKKMNK